MLTTKFSIKNYLSRISLLFSTFFKSAIIACVLLSCTATAQVANYISNGSFEDFYDCNSPFPLSKAKYWLSIDSSSFGGGYFNTCNFVVPLNGNTYQYPRTGNAIVISTLYCLLQPCGGRGYLKNRLKQNLQVGKSYCVKFYMNIANTSPRGIGGFGIYFVDSSIDTITKCNIPLSYINPQVKNPIGNVIIDTLNWVPITGTFVATGNEKYALIGNFLADNAVTTASINTPSYPAYWTDVCIDDVSCIEMDAPAYAGPDKIFTTGDSVFIGRQPDFAVDPGCVWYQLPNATPIATISGLWVKPAVTTTYVVRQELECSSLKWDTVVVTLNPVGLKKLSLLQNELKIYPIPSSDYLELNITNEYLIEDFKSLSIYNNLGQLVREEEMTFNDETAKINTSGLNTGVYYLQLKSSTVQTVSKRFVVSR